MALLDINTVYGADYPDDWKMKVNSTPVGGIANYDLSYACYCGLGVESAMSNLAFYDAERVYQAKDENPDAVLDPDFVTSYNCSDFTFAFCRSSAYMGNTSDGQSNAFIGNLDGENSKLINVYPSYQRTAPTPIKPNLNANGLYDGYGLNWTPISRFMFRDLIMVIYVTATNNLDNTNSSTFTLDEYISQRTASHPHITSVELVPYMNIPTTYTDDPTKYENWSKNWLPCPNVGFPFTDIYGGTSGNQYCGITHLNNTGIEYNQINWAMNFESFVATASGKNNFRILGNLLSTTPNKTTVYLTGAGDTVDLGQAYLPFALTSKWHVAFRNVVNQHRITYRAYRDYDETFEEEAMTQAACFGLFFMRKNPTSTQDILSSDVYMGILRNGVGHGEYTNRLDDKKNAFQYDGRSDGTGYHAGGGGGGSGPDLDGDIKTPWNKDFNFNDNFHNIYVISENDVRNMSNDLVEWTATLQPTDITDIFKTVTDFSYKEFLTNNPLECVVSLKKFPFEIPHSGAQSAVRLGNYTTAASGYSPNNLVYVWEQQIFFPCRDQSKGACFLDYEPYTTAELLIPYAGTVQIPPSKFLNHYINVKYVCDLQTGQMTVYISSDDALFTSVKSNVAFEIAVTGLDKATLDSQYNNANVSAGQQALSIGSDILGIGKSGVGVLGQIARGNVQNALDNTVSTFGDIAQTALNAQSAAYDIEHIRTPFSQVGNASPICSGYGAQTAILYVFRPVVTANLESFRQNHGFACCDVGSINSLGLTGYNQFASVDLSGFNATAEEKNIINGILQGGFYV